MAWFKFRRQSAPAANAAAPIPPLAFKGAEAAFAYTCEYMDCTLREGAFLPAIVEDASKLFGTSAAVRIQPDGNQVAALRVPSDDFGFLVIATTAGAKGPRLQAGDFVAWQAGQYLPQMAKDSKDKRFGWVGLILVACTN